jgi:hypothetical protein
MAALYATVKSKLNLLLKAIPRKFREEIYNREERLVVASLLVNDEKFSVARQIQRCAPPPRITPGKNRRKIFIKILIIEMAIARVRSSIRFAIGRVKRNAAGPLKPSSVQSIPLLIGSYDSCYRKGSLLRFV